MKRKDSMKLVLVVGERASISAKRDSGTISVEQASSSTDQTKACTSTELANENKSAEQACASTSADQADASTTAGQSCASTSAESTRSFSEQRGVLQLKRLFRDFPRFTLPAYVNFGSLFSIAQKYVEFRPIIRIILLIGKSLPFLNKKEQKNVVATVVKIEGFIYEIVEFADKPYDPKEIDDLFCRLGCRLDYICHILQKTKVQRYSPFLVFGFDVYPSERRRILVLREKNEEVDDSFLRRIGTTQTYLRTRLDTKYLGEISRDHPEFGPSIKTALSVYAAMKYLTYERQVKVFKSLIKLQETIKELVLYKTYLNVYCFERFVPSLIGTVSTCFDDLLENLGKQIVPPRKTGLLSCEPCQAVSRFVKNVNVKPEQLKRRPVARQVVLQGAVSYANRGIAQERFRNLESLFHHLAAKKRAAYMHTFLYKSRVDWLEIARQYKEYKTNAHLDLGQLGMWKERVFWRLVELEEVMAEARTFRDRIRGISFTGNETLSDSIALGGELELLASEAEDYLTSLVELIGQFLKDVPNCFPLNQRLRRSRFLFLTRDQRDAFNFPY